LSGTASTEVAEKPATDTTTAARGARGFTRSLRDARIRSKLGLLLVVPLVAVIALAGVRLLDGAQRATEAEQVRLLAQVSAASSGIMHELHRERIAAAVFTTAGDGDTSSFNAQASATDRAISEYREAHAALGEIPTIVADRLARVDQQIGTLGTTRQEILGDTSLSAAAVVLRYGVIISDVIAYQETVSQVAGDPVLAESIRAVASLSKAKAHMSEAQAAAYLALGGGTPDDEQVTAFLATQTGVQEALLAFSLAATPDQLAQVNATMTGDAVVFSERVASQVIRGGATPGADEASRALGAVVNLVRHAEQRLHVDQLALATSLRDDVRQQVILESALVIAVLVIALIVAFLLARMLARSLGQLREGALTVANRDLPETVARFSDPQNLGEHTPAQVASQVRDPIQMRSRDEIGQVAQAFNMVHQAAVRVAAEQAALRTSVSAMFLSLARRSQTLVDRMINELDDIERNEEDPKRLSRLFALDHLATRMRRNDENLLVLAGADSGPARAEDAPVADILRAAQSEVEHYARIEFGTIDSDVAVRALAVNDVVRLVAELFDNATRFSPPNSPVVAEARRLGDQVIIQVEDRGVGMPQDQANQINAWLAAPPAVEFTTFRRMGLAVVGRLATRHQIRVELRSDMRSGTVVYVALPSSILILPQHRSRAPEIPAPRGPEPFRQAPPPLPSRHLGQLPRRSAEVVSHSSRRRSSATPSATEPWTSPDAGAATRSTGTATREEPVAGRPPEVLLTRNPRRAAPVVGGQASDVTAELPIFREMEAVWFRSHGELDLGAIAPARSTGGRPSAHTAAPESVPADTSATYSGGDSDAAARYDPWQTAADVGWNAAAVAAEPPVAGATRTGLPKRVPQAQLVPGGVDSASAAPGTQRRSPEEVRGLLSAYHRGVQRGREHGGR
jgi:signal transduction histidine kinase